MFKRNNTKRNQGKQRRRRSTSGLGFESLETRKLLSANVSADFNGDGEDDLAIGVPFESVGGDANAGAVNVIYGSLAAGLRANATGSTPNDQFWHQDSPGVLGGAEAGDLFGSSLAAGDFNSDGYDDLAIGAPGEDVGSDVNAGAVNILYGSPTGLRASAFGTTLNDQIWHQDSAGIRGVAAPFDRFGAALTAGDFNNDGEDDLAIGVPGEDYGGSSAGAVNVIYGHTTFGLRSNALGTTPNDQLWHQNSAGIAGGAEAGDLFGTTLTAGDFNNDGEDDLAIGAPGEDVGTVINAGSVNVIYGNSSSGLRANALGTTPNDQIWHQNSGGIKGVAGANDDFGSALAAGDFNNDGEDDLAIGVPGEDVGGGNNAGAVNVIYGRFASGLRANALGTTPDDQLWHQNSASVKGAAEAGDLFGTALAAGDFNNDGEDDLAIGVPGEDFSGINGAGVVNVIYGNNTTGLRASALGTTPDDQLWHQNSRGIKDVAETGDWFGSALTVGDFNNDGEDDLAIGVSFEDIGGKGDVGAVNVIYGSFQTGLVANAVGNTPNDQFWHQDSPGIKGVADPGDHFGARPTNVSRLADTIAISKRRLRSLRGRRFHFRLHRCHFGLKTTTEGG